MADYYQILKISKRASNVEIKSAYRRLARKFHPDVNGGTDEAAREFAKIAKAYEILGNPQTRADYDRQMLSSQFELKSSSNSVFGSQNRHAKRWRQMAYEKRYNDIIDRMIADERRETLAFQKAIFPAVGLFTSTIIVAVFKPVWFGNSSMIGKIIFLSLFAVGLIHLISRIKTAFELYTYDHETLHESILDNNEPPTKPYSRATAISFLLVGTGFCFGIGLLIGNLMGDSMVMIMPGFFSQNLRLEFVIYPPIIVLLVDAMHSFASYMESPAA